MYNKTNEPKLPCNPIFDTVWTIGISCTWGGIYRQRITRMSKVVDPGNLRLEKTYPRMEPKKQETIVPDPTSTKLFISGLFRWLRDSIKGARVGCKGSVIGVVRITSFDVFKAVTTQLQRGRRLKMAKSPSKI
jgi:hypothetical protein